MTTIKSENTRKLPVMEAFYTVQGEGYHTGKAAYFIRLAGCDVGCVWCDVKDSWTVQPQQWKNIDDIVLEATQFPARIAVITGGEPCMYDLTHLIDALRSSGFETHIETSGAYELTGNPDWVCVSPKKFKPPLTSMLLIADELKVVVFHPSDLDWGLGLTGQLKPGCRKSLQPEFDRANKVLSLIVDFVKQNPEWKISLQTHKFIGIP